MIKWIVKYKPPEEIDNVKRIFFITDKDCPDMRHFNNKIKQIKEELNLIDRYVFIETIK